MKDFSTTHIFITTWTICLYFTCWSLLFWDMNYSSGLKSVLFLRFNVTYNVSYCCCLDWFCHRKQSAKMIHVGSLKAMLFYIYIFGSVSVDMQNSFMQKLVDTSINLVRFTFQIQYEWKSIFCQWIFHVRWKTNKWYIWAAKYFIEPGGMKFKAVYISKYSRYIHPLSPAELLS